MTEPVYDHTDAASPLLAPYKRDPAAFIREILELEVPALQAELLNVLERARNTEGVRLRLQERQADRLARMIGFGQELEATNYHPAESDPHTRVGY